MQELKIGKIIAELRKQKGITQEVLAEAVGVTGQAVSKWESGGSPDIELLQPIADYFGVSIDRLFGRKVRDYGDIETELAESIISIGDMDERLHKVFDYCWIMELAIMGRVAKDDERNINDVANIFKHRQHSQMILDKGITSVRIDKELRYFMIMPESNEGWSKSLHFKEEYQKLFLLLSDEAVLKTLFFFYSRNNKAFTPKLLEKECGIPHDRAINILTKLVELKLIYTTEIELDNELQIVYNFQANAAFIPFLTFAEDLINYPHAFYCKCGNRKAPYLDIN